MKERDRQKFKNELRKKKEKKKGKRNEGRKNETECWKESDGVEFSIIK